VETVADERGSMWRRWDPHIHTPGTALNNQYGNDWQGYLSAIESSDPPMEALGITDYCGIDRYEEVRDHLAKGRLSTVPLIFPNIELRLPIDTASGKPVNIHLLVSPEDPEHVDKTRRLLRELKFDYRGEQYACDEADLIRLGKEHDPSITDDDAARRAGTNQFKVSPDALKQAFKSSSWAQDHIIIAVAGGSRDGTSGLRDPDGSLEATRVEIERMAHVIFSSQPAQRRFWLGQGPASVEQLEAKWDGRKACLHGSDAHELGAVGEPDVQRFTWIKGDPTFESLRQACIEPEARVFIGETPQAGALDHQTIATVSVTEAGWLDTPSVPLNRGLVAIIGARGSGKTALADLLASAAFAAGTDRTSTQSFLYRAAQHLSGSSSILEWADGSETESDLPPGISSDGPPLVQYLSQQFVERLCSSEGITDELLEEIERVIFESHPYEDRLGASSFRELLNLRAEPGRLKRSRANEDMADIAAKIEAERESRDGLAGLRTRIGQLEGKLEADKKARQGLLRRGDEDRASRLAEVNLALTAAQAKVDLLSRRERALKALKDEAQDIGSRRAPGMVADLRAEYDEADLSPEDWLQFGLTFAGEPVAMLDARIAAVNTDMTRIRGPLVSKPDVPVDKVAAFVESGIDLGQVALNTLKQEAWRLGELIGLDAARAKQLRELNVKISQTESALASLKRQVSSAAGAAGRINLLKEQRKTAYASLFDGFADEEDQLAELYAPLREQLTAELGALGKLSFTVRRVVDAEKWATRGENLLDLRTVGGFRGHGELLRVVADELVPAWSRGSSDEVATAMASFREAHDRDIMNHARVSRADAVGYRQWGADVADWLNSTDHISIQYGIQYDGVDIEQLSPGTRGIVLLLLYLSVDRLDERPLVIDQPEENLDPKSIFDELVPRFRESRLRRQIVIVTHNANLVVNTDADQVIIADAGDHRPGELPRIRYTSGGLENPEIRAQVCEILEGGKRAFEERARRLRFRLQPQPV
jgi:energy-coupling factor transporter ATP-binding protein EcfA2